MKSRISLEHIKRHWLTIAFVGGFVTDFLLLNRVDDRIDNAILTAYAVLATLSLLAFYAAVAKRFGERASARVYQLASILMQYAFGGLFSGMLIFYGRSGDILASWPFLLLIIGAILGNELIKKRTEQLVFNILAYFIGIFSFMVLQVPIYTGMMGGWIFFGSSLLALILVYIVVQILALIIPNYLLLEMRRIVFAVLAMFAVLNTFYVLNIMPPIPLSIKEMTIAHSVVKFEDTGQYKITYEDHPWWDVVSWWRPTIHPQGGGIACFASVFAPTKIKTDVYHRWEYKDPDTGEWAPLFRFSYAIVGSRDDGYRGYTSTQNYRTGLYRCTVETARGQVIGRQVFYVDTTTPAKNVVTRVE
jgi:MFS family permease